MGAGGCRRRGFKGREAVSGERPIGAGGCRTRRSVVSPPLCARPVPMPPNAASRHPGPQFFVNSGGPGCREVHVRV